MNFPGQIFKAYDVRGLYPEELNEDLAYKIGRGFGFTIQRIVGRPDVRVALGRDMRVSSPSLFAAVEKGLVEQGVDVIDIGLVSTPTFYFAVAHHGYDGGMQVSASHNPKEYNGIKLVKARAVPIGRGSGMEELRDVVEVGGWRDSGRIGEVVRHLDIVDEQVLYEHEYADLKKIGKMKIVADAANAMGAQFLDALFKILPQVELVRMNWELDGTFPAHQADPFQDKNVLDLKKRVLTEKADLGIATDGDGDRIFFIDNEGNTLEPAILRGIMARLFLRVHPGSAICYDIRPGKITEDMILEHGGQLCIGKVGHSMIKKRMMETGAVFGGESSGHFFVRFPEGIYEAPMVVVLKLLQELSETKQSLFEYAHPLRRYFHSGEINFHVIEQEKKDRVLKILAEKYKDAEILEIDGLTVIYPDWWFNVRVSNTEPLVRLNLEARTMDVMKAMTKEVSDIIKN